MDYSRILYFYKSKETNNSWCSQEEMSKIAEMVDEGSDIAYMIYLIVQIVLDH